MKGYKVVSARPATDTEAGEARRLQSLSRDQLGSVRAAAQNWRNGVGLGGILAGATSLSAVPDAIAAASRQSVTDSAWLLGLGAIFTVISLALAMRSSFGWPRVIKISSMDALRSWEYSELRRTVACLRLSMISATVAVALLGLGVAVLVFQIPWPWHFPTW